MLMIAGHTFRPFEDACPCGKKLLALMSVTKADIGQQGIAHTGGLTDYEFDQIEAYKTRLLEAAKG